MPIFRVICNSIDEKVYLGCVQLLRCLIGEFCKHSAMDLLIPLPLGFNQ